MVILDAIYTFPTGRSLISYTVSMNAVRQIIYHALEDHAPSASQDQLIIQTAKANTRIPLAELRNITNIDASLSTIRRRLQEDHIHKWRTADRPAIEHLWEHIKTELHRRYSDTKDLQGSPEVIRETLRARLAEV